MTAPVFCPGGTRGRRSRTGPAVRSLAFLFVLLLIVPYVAADGGMYIADRDMWYLQPEESQLGAIHYENGRENLLLSVTPGEALNGSRAVWIFPVPAAPQDVNVDLLKGYPRFAGSDLEHEFSGSLMANTAWMVFYATFPLSVPCGSAILLPFMVFGMAGSIQKSADIQVYGRVEKMGLVTEVVSASDAGALHNFLLLRGMDDARDGRELLEGYIGRNYTFVVTSVSDMEKFRAASAKAGTYDNEYSYGGQGPSPVGVFVSFPTDRIFFPLKPTSVYGTRQVPVLLYVTGAVTPALYDTIRDQTEVEYFREDSLHADPELAPFFNGRTQFSHMLYTKIRITAPADRFTDDLWMDNTPPASVTLQDLYLQHAAPVSAAAYALLSMAASLIAGLLAFRRKRVPAARLLLHGLWNCGTFLLFASMTRNAFPQEEYGKRWPYVVAFYASFAGLLSVLVIALSPASTSLVLIGWVAGLLSPVLALGLLLIPPVLLSHLYGTDAGQILLIADFSAVITVLALLPIPMLVWLKRWLDPAPVALLPE